MEDTLLFFLHIPKTGGTTLRGIIDKQYDDGEIWHAYNRHDELPLEKKVKQFKQEELAKIKYITGHFHFGVHSAFSRPYTYVTMLRNPIERIISLYYFLSSNFQITNGKIEGVNFEEFLRTADYRRQVENYQTLYIAGGEFSLEKAKKNLENHFSAVGITEMFGQSLYLMKRKLGWSNVNYTRKNVNKERPDREEISKEIIDIIKEKNGLDIKLYDYVKRNLQKKIKNSNYKFKEN